MLHITACVFGESEMFDRQQYKFRYLKTGAAATLLLFSLTGCAAWLPGDGPTAKQVRQQSAQAQSNSGELNENNVRFVPVNTDVIGELRADGETGIPAQWRSVKPSLRLGAGDVVQVSIFEAPPSVLLSSSASLGGADLSIGSGAGSLNLPDQMVGESGTITVPYAGQIRVAGRTTTQVEQDIRGRLVKIANQPQVVVRLTQNQTNGVVVVADGRSIRLPLTAKGERLLDVLPMAGDGKRIRETSVRLTRNGVTRTLALNTLSQYPQNNVYLQNGDVVTIAQNPYRITVLGATNANATVDFGDEGLSMAEALGRVAGLNDNRADAGGVFVFRPASRSGYGELKPTIYQLNMRDVDSIALAQQFRLRDKDVVYVSNAPSIHFQKVLAIFNASLSPFSSTAAAAANVKAVGN